MIIRKLVKRMDYTRILGLILDIGAEMIRSVKEAGVEGTIVKYSGIPADDPVLQEIAAAYRAVEAF